MPLTTTLSGLLDFNLTSTSGGTTGSYHPTIDFSDSLASGVIVDTGDLLYVSKATALGGSATTNLDVAGSLTDGFGATFTAVKIKCLFIHNLSTTAGNTITIGNGTNPLLIFGTGSHTHTIGPNGILLIWEPSLAGKAVTASTGDILKILNDTANAITYDIAIVGTSA